MREPLDQPLIVSIQCDERRANQVPTLGRVAVLDALDFHGDRKWRATKVQTQGGSRAQFNGIRRLEQDASKADVQQSDRNGKSHYRQFGVRNHCPGDAAALRKIVSHGGYNSQCN